MAEGWVIGRWCWRIVRWCWLLVWVVCPACAGRWQLMQNAGERGCEDVLARHPKIASDPEYHNESTGFRESYERVVADCYLGANRTKEALDLARHWSDQRRSDRWQIEALAAAQTGNEVGVRTALEALAAPGPDSADSGFFTDRRVDQFSDRDWYLKSALRAWRPSSEVSLERHVANILGRSGQRPLPLKLAAADRQRPPGDWAVWLGIIRNGRLDRDNQRTLLFAEGAEAERHLEVIDRRVEKVESSAQYHGWGYATGSATPIYSEDRTYAEDFTPNGQHFVIRFDGIEEQLLEAPVLDVVGRFAGFDPNDGAPIIDAVIAQVRHPRESTEHVSGPERTQ